MASFVKKEIKHQKASLLKAKSEEGIKMNHLMQSISMIKKQSLVKIDLDQTEKKMEYEDQLKKLRK